MADHPEQEGHDSDSEGESEEVLPQETQTGIEQHLPPTRTISHRQRIEHADTGSQRFALHTSSMVAPSSNAQGMNYHQNLLQQQQFGGRNFSSTTHQHTRPQLLALAPHQGAVPGQQFRQPFQHGQQMGGYLMDPTRPTIAYGHPQGFDQPYSQVFPQLQPQQSIPGSQMAYYPAAQYYPRQFYHNTPSTITRPERNYITPLHPSGPAFTHGPPAIASAGPGLLQTNSAALSMESSGSSAPSSPLRGPPRKPKQSGYALWCGNLPAQTDIVELKDHFSRDATNEIESVFLISKSNCAFVNYKTEQSCTEALARFHDSRFRGAKLVCRLRRGSAGTPAGTPTGPRSNLLSSVPSQSVKAVNDSQTKGGEEIEGDEEAAQKVEEKFFVLKSLTVEDLDTSVRSGSWATQSHNEAALNTAYESAKNVYLVFSANKSGEYYGYARMASGIDDTADVGETPLHRPICSPTTAADQSVVIPTPATEHAPKGRIIDDSARGTIFWEAEWDENRETKDAQVEASSSTLAEGETGQQSLGHPFKIEWLSTQRLHFHQAQGLRNPWNQNREVKIARDGTEIEPSVGRRLVNLFHSTQPSSASSSRPQVSYPVRNLGLVPAGYPADPRFSQNY